MDLLDGEVALTEFVELDVQSVKSVGKGANGFPVLLMKGLAEPAAKGARDCEGCGKSYDADSKADNCESCGKKLPAPPASKAADKPKCKTCKDTGKIMDGNRDCPDCDGPAKKSVPPWYEAATQAVELLSLMKTPFPAVSAWSLIKAMAPDGSVDEQPDIDGGEQAIALIAKLIIFEAQELAAGNISEISDIGQLCDAASCLRWWLSGEVATQMAMAADASGVVMNSAAIEGEWEYPADDVAKASRKFSADERKKGAKEGNALPDGSYYIPDADALRRAAILAKSKHGDWQAAEKLIARRARELGVPNPLADTSKSADVAEGKTDVQTDHQESGVLAKAVADALAEVAVLKGRIESAEERATKAEAKVEEFAARPVPGGPVMNAGATLQSETSAAKAALIAEAEEAERLASTVSDPGESASYSQLAAQKRKQALEA